MKRDEIPTSGGVRTYWAAGYGPADEKSFEVPEQIRQPVFEAIGEASMCWSNAFERDGVFDSNEAEKVGDRLCQIIMSEFNSMNAYKGDKNEDPKKVL